MNTEQEGKEITAMQELLNWLQVYCDHQPYLLPEEAKRKATELLTKEREQHYDTFVAGSERGTKEIPFNAEQYFDQTYSSTNKEI